MKGMRLVRVLTALGMMWKQVPEYRVRGSRDKILKGFKGWPGDARARGKKKRREKMRGQK